MELTGMIAAERRRTADLVDSLSVEQLETPSLCGSWTVREVAAHLVSPFAAPRRSLLPLMLRSGFNLHQLNARLAQVVAREPADRIAGLLRDKAESRFRPPIVGYLGQLTDLQIHGQDIRRPLGLPHELHPDRLRVSLHFLVSRRARGFFVRKGRLDGLRFEAPDVDWAWGSGPVVRGTAEAVMLAMAGRPAVLGELDGDGVRLLRDRTT
ncbi:maleylpyruvate isomerase family mycothiol-dependent enzyme [Micromonospora chersina]|uniref:maleylpyruvate isomerase family mycothiol-dependent enzyme n=1 Tax=Micromonospora chersina TaxID=47854 RepID=UPI0037244C65